MNILIILTGIGLVAMLSEIFRVRKVVYPVTIAGLIATIAAVCMNWGTHQRFFSDMMFLDNYALGFTAVMVGTTLIWFLLNAGYMRDHEHETDYTALIIFALAGATVMVSYADLTMLFIGLEILSISMYVMSAANKNELRSNEAGLKYFLLGAFATGFLLFGIALIYGVTGTFNIQELTAFVSANRLALPPMFYAGVLLMMVGLTFKVSAAPFHFWAPDVYEGAPTPVTGFMSTVVKTAAFAAFLRLFSASFISISDWWTPVLAIFSAISMIGGNLLAVYQKSLKRMLAYSSISHAGYMLMALVAANQTSSGALLLYVAAYSVGSLGIFSILLSLTNSGNESVSALKGFASIHKFPAFMITVIMLSLAGIPPVAGFFAKYYLFVATLQTGYTWLVLVAILSSLVGVYYYFRVIIAMFQPSDRETTQIQLSTTQQVALVLAFILSIVIGLFPGFITGSI